MQREKLHWELDKLFDPKDRVRIVVELEDDPTIVYATQEGISINQLSQSKLNKIENQLEKSQMNVKNNIASNSIKMKYLDSFNTVFNGFSGEVEYGELEVIEKIPGVKKVYISNEYRAPETKPQMITSNDMIGAEKPWNLKYKGEGMIIAVIDSGGDPYHKDMVLSDRTDFALTKDKVNEIIEQTELKGKYYTDKVPFGFNYYDLNDDILDRNVDTGEHGMHVAGIAGANGDIENGGLKGVAPEAQILMMKVFSNDPIYSTTFVDLYIKAMEDAVKLGADAINISIGSDAAFSDMESPANVAVTNAVENGIVCAISAGNAGDMCFGYGLPIKENPDIGVVGTPGISKDSLQVASIENIRTMMPYIQYEDVVLNDVLPSNSVIVEDKAYDIRYLNNCKDAQIHLITAYSGQKPIYIKLSEKTIVDIKGQIVEDIELLMTIQYYDKDGNVSERALVSNNIPDIGEETITGKIPLSVIGELNPNKVFDGPVEYVYCGTGSEEELAEVDVNNKVALVIRGGLTFVDKILNAQKAGASGVVIYNYKDGEDGGETFLNILYPPKGKIPAVFIGHNGGEILRNLRDKKMFFPNDFIGMDSPESGLMSIFTSWGTTPSLGLKPEITAPGGNIYSTLQYDQYGVMSGTSMASPHVAGGAALVMQYIKNHAEYKNLIPEEQSRFAKLLLMNTADIITNPDYAGIDQIISPRRQGAGLMNLESCISTPVTLFNMETGEGKVELKDFDDTSFTMNLVAENHLDKELTYYVNVDILADNIVYDEDTDKELDMLSSRKVKANIDAPETITIPARGQEEFTVSVDFGKDELIYRNMFVEGFVSLDDVANTYPKLSIPYVGFYGSWDEPSILDGILGVDEESYYEMSAMIGVNTEYETFPYNELVMSPYTQDGKLFGKSLMIPVLSLMRNAKEIEFKILDENKAPLTTLYREIYCTKSHVAGGLKNPVALFLDAMWDGKIGKSIVPDGQYYYQIRSIIDYENAEWQEKDMPVIIDTEKPKITNVLFNEENNILSWNATDSGSGVVGFLIILDGSQVDEVFFAEDGVSEYEFDLTPYLDDGGFYNAKIFTFDKAMNTNMVSKEIDLGCSELELYLLRPGLFEISDGEILFGGFVFGAKDVQSITIDGEEIDFEYNEDLVLKDPMDPSGEKILRRGPGYVFSTIRNYETGAYEIPVTVKTEKGQEKTIVRRFYADSNEPDMVVELLERDPSSDIAEIEVTMKDDFPYLKLYINGNHEYIYNGVKKQMEIDPIEITETFTVPLEEGTNRVELVLEDVIGHQKVKFLTIKRTSSVSNDEN